MAAEGNALISRAAARDLYDWGNLIAENLFEDERDMFQSPTSYSTVVICTHIHTQDLGTVWK